MAFDGKLAVQTAVFDALTATPMPGGVPVWQHVPDNTEPPVVAIGMITLTPAGGKGGGLDQAEIDVLTFVRQNGREFMTPLMAEVRARIEGRVLTAAGASLSRPVFESDDDSLESDGETYSGTQRFSLFVQPSD